MESTISLTRNVPVVGDYDVVVCGGGPSGVMAAIAAARVGATTAIVERYGFLGGMATAGLVAPISVYNYNGRRIIDGLPWEFVGRMAEIGGAREERPLGNITFAPEKYKLIAQRMLLEAGVKLYLHSYITGCLKDTDNRITHVVIDGKSGTRAISGRSFVDATGDADLGALAGVPMQQKNSELQPASLIFMLGGVDTDSLPMIRHARQGVNYVDLDMRKALTEMRETMHIPVFGGPWYCGILAKGIVLVNLTRLNVDMTDTDAATEAECVLHEHAALFADLMRKHIPAFANSFLLATAPQTGVRETRHLQGEHILTAAEYLGCEKFPDTVARGCHPVDIHSAASTQQRCEFMKDAGFVPYRSLYTPMFPNYLVAGRALSADAVAFASLRVQASCMGIGQAAGAAAALSVKHEVDVKDVDIAELRATLLAFGANLDN
ncbi:MAG: FAD-dependent oxidoreductase [Muribaculaceae bacterium]